MVSQYRGVGWVRKTFSLMGEGPDPLEGERFFSRGNLKMYSPLEIVYGEGSGGIGIREPVKFIGARPNRKGDA